MSRTLRIAQRLVNGRSMRLSPIYSWILAGVYDQFRAGIEKAGWKRKFPFESWFPEGNRVYLPFEPMQTQAASEVGVDKDIREILESEGYTIVDYRQGLAANAQGRQYRIGKILQGFYQKDMKELEAKRENISEIKFKTEQGNMREYWNELLALYQNSAYRTHSAEGKPGFLVVISSDIHDIGAMSTGRDWTSCMNLGGGAHKEDVYCEVEKGGFVAYLIKENDRDIKRPLARIAIRRFDGKKGQSLAIPEETVYGNEIEGFAQVVQNWLDSKQGHVKPGVFYRRGGEHSDSLQDIVVRGARTGRDLLKMLRFGLADRWKRRVYVQAAMAGIVSQSKRFSPALLKAFADLLFDPANQIDILDLTRFLMRYPEYATQEAYDKLPEYGKDKFDKLDSRFRENRVRKTYDLLEGGLDIDNPALSLSPGQEISWGELGKVQDLLRRFDLIKPLPENMIRQLVKFGHDVLARFGVTEVSRGMITQVIHQLSMGDADTPSVIRFYQELLPHFNYLGLDSFGLALAKLGINGTPFLPFLRGVLQEEMNDRDTERVKYTVERLNYIIDSIENGSGRSDRYKFF